LWQHQHAFADSDHQVWRHCCQQTTSNSVDLQDRDVWYMVDSSKDEVWLTNFSTNLAPWQVRKRKVLDSYPQQQQYLLDLASSQVALHTYVSA